MITRIKLPDGSTHLRNPSDVRRTLCGLAAMRIIRSYRERVYANAAGDQP